MALITDTATLEGVTPCPGGTIAPGQNVCVTLKWASGIVTTHTVPFADVGSFASESPIPVSIG
jgi:hypothetical protein